MKKTLVAMAVTVGFALGALGQGAIFVDNSADPEGLSLLTQGAYYSGSFGLQVWELNGTTVPANINSAANTTAYANLITDGYTLVGGYTNKTITLANAGGFSLGQLNIPSVSPAGSSAVFAFAAWVGTGSSFTGSADAGVITFVNPTANYTLSPAPTAPALSGWDTGPTAGKDLIMKAVVPTPEPTTLALAGLGGAALLAFRRKKA